MNPKMYIDLLVKGIRDRDSDLLSKIFNMRYKGYKNLYFNDESMKYYENIFENDADEQAQPKSSSCC